MMEPSALVGLDHQAPFPGEIGLEAVDERRDGAAGHQCQRYLTDRYRITACAGADPRGRQCRRHTGARGRD